MPTYEYRCPDGHEFERFQRMSDEPKADCPACGKAATRLLSGGGGFIFKGEGFYLTDYRSESYREAAKREAAGAASEGSGRGDAAPEAGKAAVTGSQDGKGSEAAGASSSGRAGGAGGASSGGQAGAARSGTKGGGGEGAGSAAAAASKTAAPTPAASPTSSND